MQNGSFETFIKGVRRAWGPVTSDLVSECRRQATALVRAPLEEPWLAALHNDRAPNVELYRDPAAGFVLLAHTEHAGLYRPPHDHGRNWVMYAIQDGEVEMGSYGRVQDAEGRVRLVERDRTVLRAGDVRIYLPGDIHDTRCLSPSALLFRFTERDLRAEDPGRHPITRYAREDGVWTPAPPR